MVRPGGLRACCKWCRVVVALRNRADARSTADHVNIIPVWFAFIENNHLCIVTPECEGNLRTHAQAICNDSRSIAQVSDAIACAEMTGTRVRMSLIGIRGRVPGILPAEGHDAPFERTVASPHAWPCPLHRHARQRPSAREKSEGRTYRFSGGRFVQSWPRRLLLALLCLVHPRLSLSQSASLIKPDRVPEKRPRPPRWYKKSRPDSAPPLHMTQSLRQQSGTSASRPGTAASRHAPASTFPRPGTSSGLLASTQGPSVAACATRTRWNVNALLASSHSPTRSCAAQGLSGTRRELGASTEPGNGAGRYTCQRSEDPDKGGAVGWEDDVRCLGMLVWDLMRAGEGRRGAKGRQGRPECTSPSPLWAPLILHCSLKLITSQHRGCQVQCYPIRAHFCLARSLHA